MVHQSHTTSTSLVDGEAGRLYYRGHPIERLIEQPFAAVAHLIVFGELPEPDRLPAAHAYLFALRSGRPPTPYPQTRGYGERFLQLLHGRTPDQSAVHAFEKTQILQIDHNFNASTFTAALPTSTLAPPASALAAAMGSLYGSLHGAADQAALEMALEVATEPAQQQLLQTLTAIETAFVAQTAQRKRALRANLEFYKGVVYWALGLPKELFTATFALARIFGWTAHVVEQRRDNRIVRPTAHYIGPPPQP